MSELKNPEAVVRAYLNAMEAGDLEATVACFDSAGIIVSPVYGEVPVADFYRKLFADTVSTVVDIHTVYASPDHPTRFAAHFAYRWDRKDGSTLVTDLVDLFEFSEQSGKIARLKIVFDPSSGNKAIPHED